MKKQVKFVPFPVELTVHQIWWLGDQDEANGYGCQDVILTEEGFWLLDDEFFTKKHDHYLRLFELAVKVEQE